MARMAKKRPKNNTPKNSGKAPSLQFYFKDWTSDQRLKRASKKAKGVWIDLIALSCDMPKPGVFKDGETTLKRREILDLLTGNRRENREGFNELVKRKIIKQDDDGTFYVKRVKRDMELRSIRQECGRKGGNPALLNQNSNQTPNQTPTPSTSSSISLYSPTSNEVRLSNLLLSEIRKRKPNFREPNIQKWAIHIDRLIRLDKRTPEQVEAVIRWCQQDDFWQNNILSTEKLRKQIDHLELKMGSGGQVTIAPLKRDADGRTPRELAQLERNQEYGN